MTFREAMGNTWGKIALVMVPVLLAWFIAAVTVREKVARLETDVVDARAAYVTRSELQGRLDAILRELAGLREDVRELRRGK